MTSDGAAGFRRTLDALHRVTVAGEKFETDDDAIGQALRLAADALGASHSHRAGSRSATPAADDETRIKDAARACGLICRRIAISRGWNDAGEAPLIVFAEPGRPLLLLRPSCPSLGSPTWRVIDPSIGMRRRRLDAATASGLPKTAYQITPALPRRRFGGRAILALGWRQIRLDVLGFSCASLVAGGLAASLPVLADLMTRKVVPGHDHALFVDICLALAGLIVMNVVTDLAGAIAKVRIEGKTGALLRAAVIDRMIHLVESGRLSASPYLSTQMRTMDSWNRTAFGLVLQLSAALCSSLPVLVSLLAIAPAAAIAVVAAIAAAGAGAMIANRVQTGILAQAVSQLGSWITLSYESLKEIDTLRALGADGQAFRDFAARFGAQQARQLAASRVAAMSQGLAAGLAAAIAALVIAVALLITERHAAIDAVPLVMAAMIVARSGGGLVGALAAWPQLTRLRLIMAPLMTELPEPMSVPRPPPALNGRIQLVGISYRPAANQPRTLREISLVIEAGQHIGIVGPSGAGKTTLLDVMTGMRRPDQGAVLYDGIDLSRMDSSALRRQIGIVGQNARLFTGSLLSNVTLGRAFPDAEVWQALAVADVAADVRAMPLGLSTPVGDAASTLSGGQVQRLLFARAILGKPRILICDEATSALDTSSQTRIVAAARAAEMTVISVAHRLETILHCDRIYVMSEGRLVEQGAVAELAHGGGLFARMLAADAGQAHAAISYADGE